MKPFSILLEATNYYLGEDIDPITKSLQNKNSLGKPITQDEESLKNFYNWFGKSKVIDNKKRPLVVYHGSGNDFSSFDITSKGKGSSPKGGFFFASNIDMANSYSPRYTDVTGSVSYKEGGNVKPVYLCLKNPLTIEAYDSSWNDIPYNNDTFTTNELIDVAKNKKCDGLIIKNVYDSGEGLGIKGNIYVAFDSTQIKSAIGNKGTFSLNSTNITEENTDKMRYLGQCNKVRLDDVSEQKWQDIMNDNKQSDPDTAAYISHWGDTQCAFLHTAGFEFIFVKE